MVAFARVLSRSDDAAPERSYCTTGTAPTLAASVFTDMPMAAPATIVAADQVPTPQREVEDFPS